MKLLSIGFCCCCEFSKRLLNSPVAEKKIVSANMLICSDGLFVYVGQVKNFRNTLFELLSEALGLRSRYLKYRVQPRTDHALLPSVPPA